MAKGALVDFAMKELDFAGYMNPEDLFKWTIGTHVLEMVRLIEEQRHSGASLHMVLDLFDRLVHWRALHGNQFYRPPVKE